MARSGRKSSGTMKDAKAEPYRHVDAESPMRPEVGTQPQFRKKKPPKTYRYDSSLSPALDWDGQNWARELGEWLLTMIEEASRLDPPHQFPRPRQFNGGEVTVRNLGEAVQKLRELSSPFLNWAGKAERLSFEVPTLPLFVHERLSTKAIIETLKSHQKDTGPLQTDLFQMFGDPQHSIADQLIGAYEHRDQWVNRMILGDSLVVMNSLLEYEGLGGQVQMIYMDPPYGVKFGSNFQPFVRKRDVKHNDDEDMTREPEMVQAYRDTWELGLHSYLTYLQDRLRVARELLTKSGSLFVQISDENVHLVRCLIDKVFGPNNFCAEISFAKTSGLTRSIIPSATDYLLWYAKEADGLKFRALYKEKKLGEEGSIEYFNVELLDGSTRRITADELKKPDKLPAGARVFAYDSIVSGGTTPPDQQKIRLSYEGRAYTLDCGPNRNWKAGYNGTKQLWEVGRLARREGLRIYKRYFSDFPYVPYTTVWTDTRGEPTCPTLYKPVEKLSSAVSS